MEDKNLYNNLFNENYTDVRKNELIQKVFENKTKKILSQKSNTIKMANGGGVEEEDKTYSPYEFLYELLPQVYGRDYIVSDEVGKKYEEKNIQDEKELDEYINSKLSEFGVNSIYKIDDKSIIEEIEIKRRKIISDKAFVTQSELHAYLFCHPELHSEHYVKELPVFNIDDLRSKNLIMVEYDLKNDSYNYVYVYEYLSGYINKKLSSLRQYKSRLKELNVLSDEQFDFQQKALINSLPKQGKITKDLETCLFILPSSKFAKDFMIHPEDLVEYPLSYSYPLYNVFKQWSSSRELDKTLIKESRSIDEVHKYFTDLYKLSKGDDKSVYSDRRKKAFKDGKVILLEFLNKALTTNCQLRLETEWNEKYNPYSELKYYKIPVSCHLSNKFKNGKKFIPNETQIQSIQFMKSVGSGLLAYGVGVGKTASAMLNVSYSLDNGICKKPLFIVPNATYEKWNMEMFGGLKEVYDVVYKENDTESVLRFEEKAKALKFSKAVDGKLRVLQERIYGHLSHIKKVVRLYNLNEENVRKIKKYSDDDLLQIKKMDDFLQYLKKIDINYQFNDEKINKEIKDYYDDFEIDLVFSNYNNFIDDGFKKYWKSDKNKIKHSYNYSVGREFYIENVAKKTVKEYFSNGISDYRNELPYILGSFEKFEDGTIFLATYQALEHLGLVMASSLDLRDDDSEYGKIFNELSQGDEVSNVNYEVKKNLAVLYRDSIYGKLKTKVDIREMGFDYVVFDESHLLKKAIVDCKGIPSYGTRGNSGTSMREDRKYNFGENSYPSPISLTGYFLTRYIQMLNNDKNVIHLTATPFTNKPAEIFSMLSLTNKKMLDNANFIYMEQFFDVFMDISFELIFGNTGVTRKESLLGYRNLPQLRNLIYSIMDYKSGEDANIKRPEKILFPSKEKNIETTIPETPQQDELFKIIKDYQRGRIEWEELCANSIEDIDVDELSEDELFDYILENGSDSQIENYTEIERPLDDDELSKLRNAVSKLIEKNISLKESEVAESEKDVFRVVKGLTLLKSVTLSPYLSMCQKQAGIEPTYTEYVESSPKIMYAIKCIQSIHNYELENNLVKSGCVIYMNLGVNVKFKNQDGETFSWKEGGFEKIKQYLINKLGYSANEVSIVKGGMDITVKEREKNKFLSGKSTVLIGSSTISTGIDLQDNASALFLCAYDWNPTDNEQISGRIHRQGNPFSKIRIVYPMVMNSADPNIFQQLYEKTLRIKNIWDRNDKGNTLDLRDFDVNSLRKGILDEPEDLATFWYEEQNEELSTNENVLIRRLDDLTIASSDKNTIDNLTPVMKGIIVVLDAYLKEKEKQEDIQKMNEKLGEAQEEYNEKVAELKQQLDDNEDFAPKYSSEMKKAKDKFEKAKEKVKDVIYDFSNDPEGRYKFLTYDEIGDGDELLKSVNKWITNSDSYFSNVKKFTNDDKRIIYNNWLDEKFPRFNRGKWDLSKSEEEDENYTFVNFNSISPITLANKWKGAYRGFGKVKDNLKIIGVEFEEIPQAIELINSEIQRIVEEKNSLKSMLPNKLQEFTLAKEQRIIDQITLDQRVDEFAKMNDILKQRVKVFKEDKSKFVEIPTEKLDIKPKKTKSIEQKIEEAIIVEEQENTIDTSDLISNLKDGLVVRFNLGLNKNRNLQVVDIFYEEGEFIHYLALENSDGEVVEDDEKTLTEEQVIDFYIKNNEKISEEFFDEEEEVETMVKDNLDSVKSQSDIYKEIIEGYELALEIETNETQIQIYKDLIDGYKIAMELEN